MRRLSLLITTDLPETIMNPAADMILILWTEVGRSVPISVKCWDWISRDGSSPLVRIYRWNDTAINTDFGIPTVQERHPEGRIIFQQDNSSVYRSQDIQNWFRGQPDIEQIIWPPKSPDLNVVENMWAKLKKMIREMSRNCLYRNTNELWGSGSRSLETSFQRSGLFQRTR